MTEIFNPWAKSAGAFVVRPSGPALLGGGSDGVLGGGALGHTGTAAPRAVDGPRLRALRQRALPVATPSYEPSQGVLPARRQGLTQLVTS